METNTQNTSDKITITISKTTLIIIVTILALSMLGAGYFVFGPGTRAGASVAPSPSSTLLASSAGTITPTQEGDVSSAPEPTVSSAEVATLYQAFVCPCCGQDIGSCTCGMAEERRGLIDQHVAQGVSRSQVYQIMLQAYGAGAFFDQALAAQVQAELLAELPADRPVLVVEPAEMDLGAVPIATGLISATFTVRNAGQSDLTITGLVTTCGCTTAVLETAQGTSPVFGANLAENPTDWSVVLAPGEEASLVATFDLLFHGPDATGEFRRGISVVSNDPLNSRVDVVFDVEVTD
ncbi:MAG: DUF1573 domain-containing protein [Anaerolineae bacterium]